MIQSPFGVLFHIIITRNSPSMASQTESLHADSHPNCSENYSQTSALHPLAILQSNSAIKATRRSDLLAVPLLECQNRPASQLKDCSGHHYYTASKVLNPSRFATSDTKTHNRNERSCLKSELVREYEMALDQIESALAEKNFEITKAIREMEITLEEKERYIQETTAEYQQQIEAIESAYYKASQKLMELQNTCMNQSIELEKNELKMQNQSDIIKKTTMRFENDKQIYEENIRKKDQSINQLSRLLENQKEKSKKLNESLGTVDFNTQMLQKLQGDNLVLNQIIEKKQKQCDKYKDLAELYQLELKNTKSQLVEMSQCRLMYKQSEKILGQSNIVSNLMLKELNDTKQKLSLLTLTYHENQKVISQQNAQLATLRFENQTLEQYNKVLLQKLQGPGTQLDRSKQSKWQTRTASTFYYAGSI